jgi:hypothetical protein
MALHSKRSNFWVGIFGLILYTLLFGAIPLYHQMTGHDMKPALNINLDGSTLLFSCSALRLS